MTGRELRARLEAAGLSNNAFYEAVLKRMGSRATKHAQRNLKRYTAEASADKQLVLLEPYRSAVAHVLGVPAETFDRGRPPDRLDSIAAQLDRVQADLEEVLRLLRAVDEESQQQTLLEEAGKDLQPVRPLPKPKPRSSRATRRGAAQ